MEKRINILNEMVEKMKDKPFSEYDLFTGIHGHHRNRRNYTINIKNNF